MERLSPPAQQQPDWTTKAADTIETVVTTVRDRTVAPATLVAKALVFGTVVATVTAIVAFCLAVALIRLLNSYLFDDWLSEAMVGGIFALAGLLALAKAWSARRP